MKTRKVAIIDYDKNSIRELDEILAGSGYTPVLINDEPDIILMELSMLRKNGFELIDAINRISEEREIPIIMMSEFFNDKFNYLFDLYDIKRRIKKPFLALDVIWAIENELKEGLETIVV